MQWHLRIEIVQWARHNEVANGGFSVRLLSSNVRVDFD